MKSIQAQDVLPVIEPKTIFADVVEVVETLPVLNYDNTKHLLWYFNTTKREWQAHHYRAGLDRIEDIQPRSDGTYLISNLYYEGIAGAEWEHVWLFNPATGVLGRPAQVCNLVQALPGEGQWLLTQLDGKYHLCNTETGQITSPLSDEIQTEEINQVCDPAPYLGSTGLPSLSPDGKWLVFYTCHSKDNWAYKKIYAYRIDNETLLRIGGDTYEYISVERWLDNTHPIIGGGELRTGGSHWVAIADVQKEDSFRYLAGQYAYQPLFLSDPPRLLWVTQELDGDPVPNTDVQRTIHQYDFQSIQETTLPPEKCKFSYCEAGYVAWGSDKTIGVVNGYPLNFDFIGTVVDAKTGKKLYETHLIDRFYPLGDDTYLFEFSNPVAGKNYLKSVHINKDYSVVEDIYPDSNLFGVLQVSPDRKYVLDNSSQLIDIYDLVEAHRFSITKQLEKDAEVKAEWRETGLLEVELSQPSLACANEKCIVGKWLLRVPGEAL
jgi:hypothetical protein